MTQRTPSVLRWICGIAILSVGTLVAMNGRKGQILRTKISQLEAERAQVEDRRREMVILKQPPADRGENEEEKQQLAMVERLKAEIAAIRLRAKQREKGEDPADGGSHSAGLSMTAGGKDEGRSVNSLQDVGAATPEAAVETALWAAAGGDVERLAALIHLSEKSRREVDDFLKELPWSERMKFPGPEGFVATMTAVDIPLGTVRLYAPRRSSSDTFAALRLTLRGADGRTSRTIDLAAFQRNGTWQFVAPESAVERYVQRIKGQPASAPPPPR